MTFTDSVKALYKNAFNYSGRATRSEYWWVVLYNILLYVAVMIVSFGTQALDITIIGAAFAIVLGTVWIANMICGISLTVRRLHDTGKSGWWILFYLLLGCIPIIGFIFSIMFLVRLCQGSDFDNEWGPDPDGEEYLKEVQ